MTKTMDTLLQLVAVASVVAAFVLFLVRAVDPGRVSTSLSAREGWFTPENRRVLAWAVVAAVGSRLLLVALTYGALALVNRFGSDDLKFLLSGYGFGDAFPSMKLLFSRWDGPHYLDIAKLGYTADQTLASPYQDQWLFIVFYPLYPALIALVKPLVGNEFSAATAVSWACLAGACYWLYRLALLDGPKDEAKRAVKFLLVFPTAIFLGAPYTESLFLLLTILCLYAMRKGQWWLAGVTGFLAALTRNMGVLLAVPFAVELLDRLGALADPGRLRQRRFWAELIRHGSWVLLMPLGMIVYLLINKIVYGDPFMFLTIQNQHWGQHMQLFWQSVQTTWQCLTGDRAADQKAFLWAPQLAGMLAMLVALPFFMKRLRPSYGAYLLVYVVVALSPSWLLSFNRYMMGAAPLFLGLAQVTRKRWADDAVTVVFALLMLFLSAGYVMWEMVV